MTPVAVWRVLASHRCHHSDLGFGGDGRGAALLGAAACRMRVARCCLGQPGEYRHSSQSASIRSV